MRYSSLMANKPLQVFKLSPISIYPYYNTPIPSVPVNMYRYSYFSFELRKHHLDSPTGQFISIARDTQSRVGHQSRLDAIIKVFQMVFSSFVELLLSPDSN